MKVKVKEENCIGCGYCEGVCDEVFRLNDDGVSQVILSPVPEELEDKVKELLDKDNGCPTNAIVETKD